MTFPVLLLAALLLAAGTRRQSRLLPQRLAGPSVRRMCLAAGYGILLLSLVRAATGPDGARATVGWFGDLTLAALLAVLLSWRLDAQALNSPMRPGSSARGSGSH